MTISTLKRKLDDQDDVDLFHSKSKRCKFNIQKELISEIIITTNTLDIMIKKPLISQQESIENISCEYEFNLSQGEDLQECCRQTVRSYLLERSLGLIRNPDNV